MDNTGYGCGDYQSETVECKEKDDYWIFWSRKKFVSYFRDGKYIDDEEMSEDVDA